MVDTPAMTRNLREMTTGSSDPPKDKPQRLNAAIVGGGKGCEALLRMAAADRLGRFRMRICGVADINPEAPGLLFAKAVGIPLITNDFHELDDHPNQSGYRKIRHCALQALALGGPPDVDAARAQAR